MYCVSQSLRAGKTIWKIYHLKLLYILIGQTKCGFGFKLLADISSFSDIYVMLIISKETNESRPNLVTIKGIKR